MNTAGPMEVHTYPQELGWWCLGIDLIVTLILWSYFTLGFILFFFPLYLCALIVASDRGRAIRALNHYFFRGFFCLCRLVAPRHRWRIDPAIPKIHSSVVIANHISYLDSILMVSMFKRHTTIVKADLFTIPIMGLMLRLSGYLPSAGTGHLAEILVQRTEDLPRTLAAGDNLFIFPEGTRSRDGTIGEFSPGAFKLARLCRTPIHVLRIRNSDRLFKPGRFLFQTCRRNTISIDLAAQMNPHYDSQDFSIDVLMKQARQAMDNQPIDNEAA